MKNGLKCGGSRNRPASAFTLAETLAAMMFLAVVLPVVIQGLALANRAAIGGERLAVASRLGEQWLNRAVAEGQWRNLPASGSFAPDYPGFRWRFEDRAWIESGMRELILIVEFETQGRPQEAILSSLVPESEAETDTGATR